jgi:hypothetical protein
MASGTYLWSFVTQIGHNFQPKYVMASTFTNIIPWFSSFLFSSSPLSRTASFNFTFRYSDDGFSLNNVRLRYFVDRIYPIELEIKDTTDTDRSASYLDLHLEIDSKCEKPSSE